MVDRTSKWETIRARRNDLIDGNARLAAAGFSDRADADPAQSQKKSMPPRPGETFHSKMSDIQKNLEMLQAKRKEGSGNSQQAEPSPKKPGYAQELVSKPLIAKDAIEAYKAARERRIANFTPSASSSPPLDGARTIVEQGGEDEGGEEEKLGLQLKSESISNGLLSSPTPTVPGPLSPAGSWKPPRPPGGFNEPPEAGAAVEKLRVAEVRLQHAEEGLDAARKENHQLRQQVTSLSGAVADQQAECSDLRERIAAMEAKSSVLSAPGFGLTDVVEPVTSALLDPITGVQIIDPLGSLEAVEQSQAEVQAEADGLAELEEALVTMKALRNELEESKVVVGTWQTSHDSFKDMIHADEESSALFTRIRQKHDPSENAHGSVTFAIAAEAFQDLLTQKRQIEDARSSELIGLKEALQEEERKHKETLLQHKEQTLLLQTYNEAKSKGDGAQESLERLLLETESRHLAEKEAKVAEALLLQKRLEDVEAAAKEEQRQHAALKESAVLLQTRLLDAEKAVAEALGCGDALDAIAKEEEVKIQLPLEGDAVTDALVVEALGNGIPFETNQSAPNLQKALEDLRAAKAASLDLFPSLQPGEKEEQAFEDDDKTRLARHGFIQTSHRNGLWPLDSSWGEELSFGSVDALPAFGSNSHKTAPTQGDVNAPTPSTTATSPFSNLGTCIPIPALSAIASDYVSKYESGPTVTGHPNYASLEEPFTLRSVPLSGGALFKDGDALYKDKDRPEKEEKDTKNSSGSLNSTPPRTRPTSAGRPLEQSVRTFSPQAQSMLRPGGKNGVSIGSAISASPHLQTRVLVRPLMKGQPAVSSTTSQVVRSSSSPLMGARRSETMVVARQQKSPIRVSFGTPGLPAKPTAEANGTAGWRAKNAILAEQRAGIEALSKGPRSETSQMAVPSSKLDQGKVMSISDDNLDRAMKELQMAKSSSNLSSPSPF